MFSKFTGKERGNGAKDRNSLGFCFVLFLVCLFFCHFVTDILRALLHPSWGSFGVLVSFCWDSFGFESSKTAKHRQQQKELPGFSRLSRILEDLPYSCGSIKWFKVFEILYKYSQSSEDSSGTLPYLLFVCVCVCAEEFSPDRDSGHALHSYFRQCLRIFASPDETILRIASGFLKLEEFPTPFKMGGEWRGGGSR